jgi:hypothetical protein
VIRITATVTRGLGACAPRHNRLEGTEVTNRAVVALWLLWAPVVVAGDPCPALPPASGTIVNVATVLQLQSAVQGASPGDVILIADGTYNLDGVYLWLDTPNVTVRSASGDRDAVILDGNYLTTEIVVVAASEVTIADLTLREAYYHPIHVVSTDSGDTLDTLIYNVRIVDPGQQAIKINPHAAAVYFPDDGTIACSHVELTPAGRAQVLAINGSCYTGGVDAHAARGWTIRDNLIEGFWCASGLSEHAIHLWRGCRGTAVERNTIRDCARGLGFGLASSGSARTYGDDPCPGAGYVGHYGGVIRNNAVFAGSSGLFASADGFDCGICLASACGAQVYHNTVASTQAPFSSIEWRFPSTDADIANNLATHNFMERDGASAALSDNLASQPLTLFVDGPAGDLHLLPTATVAIDRVAAPPGVLDDLDGDVRPFGPASDVGADEHRPGDAVSSDGFESGDTSGWSRTGGAGCSVEASAVYLGSYGLEVTVGSSCGSPDEVVLSPQTVTGALEVEACVSITAGGGFTVAEGGSAIFTAGSAIGLENGFSIQAGGTFGSILEAALSPFSYVQDDSPASETRFLAQFFVDLDGLVLGAGDELHHLVASADGGDPQLRLVVRGGPELVLEVRDDVGTFHATSGVALSAGWNRVDLAWEASPSATVSLSVNNGTPAVLTGLDTDARRIDSVRWGVVGGDIGGSSGALHLDGFSSWR